LDQEKPVIVSLGEGAVGGGIHGRRWADVENGEALHGAWVIEG
jgi:hypothetical protein